jgi:hypothetical protein
MVTRLLWFQRIIPHLRVYNILYVKSQIKFTFKKKQNKSGSSDDIMIITANANLHKVYKVSLKFQDCINFNKTTFKIEHIIFLKIISLKCDTLLCSLMKLFETLFELIGM